MSSASNATVILEIADNLRKSWWTVIAGVCIGLAAAMVGLHFIPKTYEASTLIFVAPQSVPQEFVRSTVTDDMSIRLRSLKEAVLSTPYIERLVEKYIGKPADALALEKLVKDTRIKIQVELIGVSTDNRGKAGGTFRLSYRDSNAQRAANMVNALAAFYMEQNASTRAAQAEGTTKTIQSLADDVAQQLEAKQHDIAEFRARHLYETGDQQEVNLQQLGGRQSDLNANAAAHAAALDRLSGLKAQAAIADASAAQGGTVATAGSDRAGHLVVAEQELQALRAKYTEANPEVIAKAREVEDLKALIAAAGGGASNPSAPQMTPLLASIRSAEREIQRLESEEVQIKADIAEYKRRLEATPRVQAQYLELTKGYDVLLEQYKRRQGNAEEARSSQKIEESQQGERFEVIERATPPMIPIRPIPIMIYAAGLLAGLLFFVGPVVARGLLDPVICSESGLLELADSPVLVSIPRLVTDDVARAVRGRLVRNLSVSLASVAVLVATVLIFVR